MNDNITKKHKLKQSCNARQKEGMVTNMKNSFTSKEIIYVGVDDKTLDLFESQYIVPNGVSYNSYIILDEKIAIMDTVDKRATCEWLDNVEKTLNGKNPDYLVVSHLEPDHAASIAVLVEKYPNITIVGNAKTFSMMPQFFDIDLTDKTLTVKEGEVLNLGKHSLTFLMAPMVHWPEVMVSYESSEKILFSADAFGKFGALDTDEAWDCEARRYYINIVGKYGAQVQALLKKVGALDVQTICPLHGPILSENLEHYIEKYNIWSSYQPEDEGVVIAYASIHGNTAHVAEVLADILREKGAKKVSLFDLSRDDMAEAIEDAFRYSTLVLACATYDGGLFPPMESFLHHIKSKTYRNRKVAFVENGSWAITAGKQMKAIVETFKDVEMIEPTVTIRSVLKDENLAVLNELAQNLLA